VPSAVRVSVTNTPEQHTLDTEHVPLRYTARSALQITVNGLGVRLSLYRPPRASRHLQHKTEVLRDWRHAVRQMVTGVSRKIIATIFKIFNPEDESSNAVYLTT